MNNLLRRLSYSLGFTEEQRSNGEVHLTETGLVVSKKTFCFQTPGSDSLGNTTSDSRVVYQLVVQRDKPKYDFVVSPQEPVSIFLQDLATNHISPQDKLFYIGDPDLYHTFEQGQRVEIVLRQPHNRVFNYLPPNFSEKVQVASTRSTYFETLKFLEES
jgi:hypothetical protein